MTDQDIIAVLRDRDIQPTPQRIAVAQCVLGNTSHPTAEEVWRLVQESHPTLSRATVYNTLNLFVTRQLLRTQLLREGTVVFDPFTERHHHFVDEESGEIVDIPWDALQVKGELSLQGYEIHEFQVVMRGRRKPPQT